MHISVMCRIECSPATISMDDWILDVCGLCSDGDSSVFGTFRVAAATAHNTVHIIELTTGGDARETALYRCEVNCILYPIERSCLMATCI